MAEPASAPIAASVTDLLEHAAERWRTCEGVAQSDLLRLAVLRDLLHELHAQKSRFLSQGKREDALSIREVEGRIEALRASKPLSGELTGLLSQTQKLKKRTRVLPDSLFTAIDREKLERYDRQWEAALASEALAQGWRVWSLEAWVEIPKIDAWNKRLVDSLWPDGIVLYVESAGTSPERDARSQGESAPAWLGRWVCLMHPQFKAPVDILLDFSKWPGTHSGASWRILFSPKSS